MALANLRAYVNGLSVVPFSAFLNNTHLCANLFLVFSRKVDEMVVLRADQEWDSGFVEATTLPIPFLDTVQGALPREIKHE